MADIELVIKIDEETYNFIKRTGYTTQSLYNAIINGTPLPKGHGRLIDADSMKRIDAIQRGDFNSIESIRAWIDIIPTVIEADKESEDI